MIKSPLRYPGGKSKAIASIAKHLPDTFSEYREPCVGGGSVFIYLKQVYPDLKIWINDLNPEVYYFWKYAQSNLDELIREVTWMRKSNVQGQDLHRELVQANLENLSGLERATRFFVLNRITFSGTTESGGFSPAAFESRFTMSSIERLSKMSQVLDGVKITNLDYGELLGASKESVFLYIDPPYFLTTKKANLYGKRGNLHSSFEHERLAESLGDCPHKWLVSYDNCPTIRDYFSSAHIHAWELQYAMSNSREVGSTKGKEIFITNYE
ncbi:MAG: DNA adenine methylase [Crinalium sp.]